MFASVGRDGTALIWDHMVKKQLQQYPKYVLRVQDIAFNVDRLGLMIGVRNVLFILFLGGCGCGGG